MKHSNKQAVNLKPSQREFIKNHLLAGETITQAQLIKMLDNPSARLAPRILDLRKFGYPIETIKLPLSDGTHVARYALPQWFLTLVADNGLQRALWVVQISKKHGVA